MSDDLKTKIPMFILDHYTMHPKQKIGKFGQSYNIKIEIIFSPKDPDDVFTPKECKYSGRWFWYSDKDKIVYNDASYITKEDMPLLTYFGDEGKYWFIEFYENFAYHMVTNIINELKS